MRSHRRLVWIWVAVIGTATALAQAGTPGTEGGGGETVRPAQPKNAAPEKPAAQEGKDKDTKPEGKGDDGKDSSGDRPGGMFGGSSFIFIMLGVIVLMFVLTSRSKRKQETKRKEMLASLRKGDKVTTIGGVFGTVMEVREDEVTVKVDETNNIRVRFARWAVRGVGETAKTEKPEDKR